MLATPTHNRRMTSLLRKTTPLSCLVMMLFLLPTTSADTVDVDYAELQELGVNCFPEDSCSQLRSEDTLENYNCHCGPHCVELDTCCVDSAYRGTRPRPEVVPACLMVPQVSSKHVFMVNRCKRGWKGEDYVKAMCRGDGQSLSDPLLVIPVTSPKTLLTYKNVFCAACNGEGRGDGLVFWDVRITRLDFELPPEALRTLNFEYSRGSYSYSWAIQDGDGKTDAVKFHLGVPPRFDRHVRSCRSHSLVSECANGWSDDVTRKKCAAYMGVVFVDYLGYRNAHCAICNFERNVTDKVCAADTGVTKGRRPPLSFALLLDVNRSDGEVVGQVDPCAGENAVYDPFFKRCRMLKCALPGHKIKDGKCVKV